MDKYIKVASTQLASNIKNTMWLMGCELLICGL